MTTTPLAQLESLYGTELATLEISLEHEAYTLGQERFQKGLQRSKDKGRLHNHSVASPLVSLMYDGFLKAWDVWLQKYSGTRPRGGLPKAYPLLKDVDPSVAAILSIKGTLSCLGATVQKIAVTIARSLEYEQRFSRIREVEHEYLKISEGLGRRVATRKKMEYLEGTEKGMLESGSLDQPWTKWGAERRLFVGVKLLELLMEGAPDVLHRVLIKGSSLKDHREVLMLTPEYQNLLTKRESTMSMLHPFHQPMVVPPKPWSRFRDGGYWSGGIARPKLIKRRKAASYRDWDLRSIMKSVNLAQSTAWRVNTEVLKVLEEVLYWDHSPFAPDIPSATSGIQLPPRPHDIDTNPEALKQWKKEAAEIYRTEKARVSKRLRVENTLSQARKFSSFKAIYFPMHLDWRGRLYCIPSFSPQQDDLCKGLLRFSQGKPLGTDGLYWLKIHGANTYGIDNVPFRDRIAWTEEHHSYILEVAHRPTTTIEWWAKADSPFCFLAFCLEYSKALHQGPSYVCALPVAFDGSCSGIQHFSAMLRDPVGAKAVNLCDSEEVHSVYTMVAESITDSLKEDLKSGTPDTQEIVTGLDGSLREVTRLGTKTLAKGWLEHGVTKKVTKKAVMTIPYAAKTYGFKEGILHDTIIPAMESGSAIMFTKRNAPSFALYLAQKIWEVVNKDLVGALGCMKYIQECAKAMNAIGKPTHWVTPDGLPIWNNYPKRKVKRLMLMLDGPLKLTLHSEDPTKVDSRRQISSIAANYVHSMDATHLRMTVTRCHEYYNIDSLALIHDSFGTVPADASALYKAVRESFVELYTRHDVIQDFHQRSLDACEGSKAGLHLMPSQPPQKGTFNIEEVLEASYAFA